MKTILRYHEGIMSSMLDTHGIGVQVLRTVCKTCTDVHELHGVHGLRTVCRICPPLHGVGDPPTRL